MAHPVSVLSRCLICLCCAVWGTTLQGQEFSIYTRIYQDVGGKPAKQPTCRCQTLFHANRGYDYIDPFGDVTIVDSITKRVTVLHGSRKLATSFTLDELADAIAEAVGQAEDFLKEPIQPVKYESAKLRDFVKFQINPEFEEQFDSARKQLKLSSDVLTYEAVVAKPKSPLHLATYLKFADATTQINYVLHPQAMLPPPRLRMNAALREREVIPVKVVLQTHVGRGLTLRAEHQFQWELGQTDRQMIHQWEELLENKEMQVVSLKEFQMALQSDDGSAKR